MEGEISGGGPENGYKIGGNWPFKIVLENLRPLFLAGDATKKRAIKNIIRIKKLYRPPIIKRSPTIL